MFAEQYIDRISVATLGILEGRHRGVAVGPAILAASSLRPDPVSLAFLPFNMLDGLQKAGVDLDELAKRSGLAPQDLRRPLSPQQADRLFIVALEMAPDPSAGIALGLQPMRAELFGVVGFAGMTSGTFGAGLKRIARYNALVSACAIDILERPDSCEYRVSHDGPLRPYSRTRLDIQMGTLLSFGRTFTERQIVPMRLTLTERPAYHARYLEYFGCSALFEQPHDAIVFSRDDLDLPLVSANPHMAALFEEAAERDLRTRAGSRASSASAVRGALRQHLHVKVPSVEEVAHELNMSTRTLQRRLAEEGVRFTRLLDEARMELAQRYLLRGQASLTEIAHLLGFEEANSFFRFFKRWAGETPADFRRRTDSGG